jgi:predicted transcriptional regulator
MEREQLQQASTLVVTVDSAGEFHEDVRDALTAMEGNEDTDSTPTLAFESYDELMDTLTPHVLGLVEAIQRQTLDRRAHNFDAGLAKAAPEQSHARHGGCAASFK